MSDLPPNDSAGLALTERLRILREACVVKARFSDAGDLTFVEFGALEGGPMLEGEEDKKPNPVREAALRLARPHVAASE